MTKIKKKRDRERSNLKKISSELQVVIDITFSYLILGRTVSKSWKTLQVVTTYLGQSENKWRYNIIILSVCLFFSLLRCEQRRLCARNKAANSCFWFTRPSSRGLCYESLTCIFNVFFKMGQPRHLFHLFSSFQTHITIFTNNKCEKNFHPVYGDEIQTHDLWNITTRPGLPFNVCSCIL